MKTLFKSLALVLLLTCGCSNRESQTSSEKHSYLQIAATDDPTSLDPRLVRDLSSSTFIRMFYEGLMRTNSKGEVSPGIAENVEISEDKKTYTFHLRSSMWSDGSPLTANDFEQSWKSLLSPAFPAPNAYQYYLIKGAKKAKEGKISLDEIGVKALNPSTLIVELEDTAPYFLEMTSCHFFFPVHQSKLQQFSDANIEPALITNGPFKLDSWGKRSELVAVKNPLYWDVDHVLLEGISLQILDENTALQLFKAGKLDWVGSPLSTLPQDSISSLRQQNQLQITAGGGTHWFRLNTSKPPFNDKKMREAFSLALNRQTIVDHVTQGNQLPAIGIIPPSFGFKSQTYYSDHEILKAQALYKESLEATGLTFPKISLRYSSNDRNHKIAQAVQQQWNKSFGIDVALEGSENQIFLEKVKTGDYEISMGAWYADIRDPINFLEVFKYSDNPTNQTFWQNENYQAILNHSSKEFNLEKRFSLLEEAEKFLIQEMPIIPIFHSAFNYLKSDSIDGVYLSPLGYLDFKEAHFKEIK